MIKYSGLSKSDVSESSHCCAVPVSLDRQGRPKPAQNGEFLTVQQLADLLQCSRHAVYVWLCKNRFPFTYYKIHRIVRFKRSDVDRWIETKKIAQVESL